MNHPPEDHAVAPNPTSPPPEEAAAKGGDGYFSPMIDLNSKQEKEKPSCSSSSSDSDSDDDFFQIDAPELLHPPAPSLPIVSDPLTDLIPTNLGRKPSDEVAAGSERRSPAMQVMARGEVGDPNRIPSSVFARSSPTATPSEWSAASNESLFSIHTGNSSFSRDQYLFMMGISRQLPPSMWPAASPPAAAAELGEEAAASANAAAMRDVMRAAEEGKEVKGKPAVEALGHSISRHSDGSTNSFRSFAFPILTGDGRFGSLRADFGHHAEHQPTSPIELLKATPAQPPAAVIAIPFTASSQLTAPVSLKSRWFPCLSCCTFCC